MSSLVRVLEVGGTHVTAATVDVGAQQVRDRSRHVLDSAGTAASILAGLRSAALTLADPEPTRWAIAIPDPFDYERGIGLFRDVGKFDALYGVDVGHALSGSITPRPRSITFIHDTEAFLVGEWLRGAARGATRCAAVTLGTGVGSAFLAGATTVRCGPGLPPDGRIHRVSVDGAPLEERVSRRAIRAHYAAATGDDLDVHEIADRARRGDACAGEVLHRAFEALGRALAPVLRGFAPDVLVVGGSIAGSWDLLLPPLTAGLRDGGAPELDIRRARYEIESSVLGAAWHAALPAARTPRPAPSGSAARDAVARLLAAPDLIARLSAYYAPDGAECGTNFLDGTEACSPDAITAADLFAVTTLGLEVPAAVARRLLHDTAASAAASAGLAGLPRDVTLEEATPAVRYAMNELHEAVLAAVGADVLATALCARKRPELFPVLDAATCRALRLPSASVPACWRVLRAVLRDREVRPGLERAFGAVRRRGLGTDVYPLRRLGVLAAITRDRY